MVSLAWDLGHCEPQTLVLGGGLVQVLKSCPFQLAHSPSLVSGAELVEY